MSNVGPLIGREDVFEGHYTEKFRTATREHGEFVKYERDRASLDFGLHLTTSAGPHRRVSKARIWFQLKGIHKDTLPLSQYRRAGAARISLQIDQLKFWFASPEPVYLALYLECADIFLVEDIQEIVYRTWGGNFLAPDKFSRGQQSVTVEVSSSAELTDDRLRTMQQHQSMRIDGPYFRGRPLGHRLDPLRCSLNRLDPSDFLQVTTKLLEVHGYRVSTKITPESLFQDGAHRNEHVVVTQGVLYNTFELVPQLSTEFGYGVASDFRQEGAPQYVQGLVAVLIDADPQSLPSTEKLRSFAQSLVDKNIHRLLVFANTDDYGYFGAFFGGCRDGELDCMPQLLGDLSYNLLTVTSVYLEFRHLLSWKLVNFLE